MGKAAGHTAAGIELLIGEDRILAAGETGQIIYDILPEELKEEFSSLNGSIRLGIDDYSTEAARLIRAGDSEGAGKKLEEGIALFEGSDIYNEKDGVPFYDFRKPMEEALFREEYGFEKRIKLIPEPIVGLYRMYAGLLYEQGLGVEQDYAQAASWYKKGVEASDLTSGYYLALLYKQGLGVGRDYEKAADYFASVAASENKSATGVVDAGYELAQLYEQGLGVEKDIDHTIALYQEAAECGSEDAAAALDRLNAE